MQNNVSNIILTIIFGGMGVWLMRGYLRTRKHLKYKDKKWNGYRITFLVAGILVLLTVFLYHTVLDFIRIIAMIFCIIAFLLERDGVGDDGICSVGRFIPWKNVKGYDFQSGRKKFTCYFNTLDEKDKEEFFVSINFPAAQEEEIRGYLKDKIGKKYTRMRKG